MPSNKPVFAVRTTVDIKQKLEHIAEENNRSASKEIEYLIKKHIQRYEDDNGSIELQKENQ